MQIFAILLLFVALASGQSRNTTFTLFATDMSGCDTGSACDLHVTIRCSSISSDWKICGETSKLQDDNFPVWPEVFTFEHTEGTSQRWRFDLIDEDVAFNDVIATFDVIVDTYESNAGNLYQLPLPGNEVKGIFWIHRRTTEGVLAN